MNITMTLPLALVIGRKPTKTHLDANGWPACGATAHRHHHYHRRVDAEPSPAPSPWVSCRRCRREVLAELTEPRTSDPTVLAAIAVRVLGWQATDDTGRTFAEPAYSESPGTLWLLLDTSRGARFVQVARPLPLETER